MNCSVSNVGGTTVIRTTRVLREPTAPGRGSKEALALTRSRKHKRKWVEPSDAKLILGLHFTVVSPSPGLYYAEASLEIPTKTGSSIYSHVESAKNRYDALTALIRAIECSNWFAAFKEEGVYFRITGCEMEELYRGYL